MLSSLQKNPRLNGGVMSAKKAFTILTIRKHPKSTTIENFLGNIGTISLSLSFFHVFAEDSRLQVTLCGEQAVATLHDNE